jgi:hypothetical protein
MEKFGNSKEIYSVAQKPLEDGKIFPHAVNEEPKDKKAPTQN